MPPKPVPIRIVETGEIFMGLRAVARAIDGDHATVRDCLIGERISHKGYTFEFVDQEDTSEVSQWL